MADQIKRVPRASAWCRIMTAITIDPTTLERIRNLCSDDVDVARVVGVLLNLAASSQAKPADDALLTRRDAADFITKELGYPIAFSTLAKLCAIGEGPSVARKWGRRPLYTRHDLTEWVEARSKSR